MLRTLFSPKNGTEGAAHSNNTDRSRSRGRTRRASSASGSKTTPSRFFSGQPFSRYPTPRDTQSRERNYAVYDYGEDEAGRQTDNQHDGDDEEDENEDGPVAYQPILPVFSRNLDSIPVYEIIHEVRQLVVQRTDTSLTWDQLRSPQVSQFLVRPIINNIRENYKQSPALLYALMANCLQFSKESAEGLKGTEKTRAMLCELAAIKLLKDYTPRQLIDALSYDFFPLQGAPTTATPYQLRVHARVSALEIAIRTQAKKFLATPLVVQQLEAIWSGNIVFSSEIDSYHRRQRYEARHGAPPGRGKWSRRAVTIYDPSNASLGKLSRLRVPLYRQMMSTLSLTILLGLYLAVLITRSLNITTTEVVLWFWSAGFMLDEIIGVTETGFELYILSLWNAFDIGILVLFMVFYIMRLYGLFVPEELQDRVSDLSYDVLATCAIFLFPRLFSVLDNYRYFSQLLIGFKLMFADLIALILLIVISCSGFFVAFTLSFAREFYSAKAVAFNLLQMSFGFTPAAWDTWDKYNVLGKIILIAFLTISHFLIVTILITVLTNSYLKVSANAYEEHQFVFAVNTISLVKSDAMFMYVAPFNIIELVLHPLRYVLPFRQYIYLNRSIIKVTHFPLLFAIYLYEKVIMRGRVLDAVSSLGGSLQDGHPATKFVFRRDSMLAQQKDLALEAVFRRPRRDERTIRALQARQKADGAVTSWMKGLAADNEGSRERGREDEESSMLLRKTSGPYRSYGAFLRDDGMPTRTMSVQSIRSDPEDFVSTNRPFFSPRKDHRFAKRVPRGPHDDEDGDDELFTNDDEEPPEEDIPDMIEHLPRKRHGSSNSDSKVRIFRSESSGGHLSPYPRRGTMQTAIYDPISEEDLGESSKLASSAGATGATAKQSPMAGTGDGEKRKKKSSSSKKATRSASTSSSETSPFSTGKTRKSDLKPPVEVLSSRKSPRGAPAGPSTVAQRITPVMGTALPTGPPPAPIQSKPTAAGKAKMVIQSAPNYAHLLRSHRRLGQAFESEAVFDPDDDVEDEGPLSVGSFHSFQTKMAMANARGGGGDGILSRLLLTKIGAIEEGFKDFAKELKELKKDTASNKGKKKATSATNTDQGKSPT